MREIRIEKLTLNIGSGKDQKLLEKGMKLLKKLTGVDPVRTITTKRIQAWALRPGLPIGCKITIRDQQKIQELLPRLLEAKETVLREKMFDNYGNVSFGIPECIDIADYNYDPEIGIIGLQATMTLIRPGYRVARRRLHKGKVNNNHIVNREDAVDFMKKHYAIKLQEEIDE
ncbi:MAG: 50S ribosomal protein L5 [Nanoarchaeota archaeon]